MNIPKKFNDRCFDDIAMDTEKTGYITVDMQKIDNESYLDGYSPSGTLI